MTDLNSLTPEEKEAINRLRNFKNASYRYAQTEEHRVKNFVDPEEYDKRLKNSLRRDEVLVKEDKARRVEKATLEWKNKVGKTFSEATTDNPLIHDRVNRLATNQGKHKTSMILHGDLGVGKTWTAHAFINLAIEAGAVTPGQIAMGDETSLLGKIAPSGYDRPALLEDLLNPKYKIYFIDEVGRGYFSNDLSRTNLWTALVDHVYTHQLSLVMTTNKYLTDNSLGAWMGAAAFDRLKALVGKDGAIVPGRVNRRGAVLEKEEEKHRTRRTR